MLAPLHTHLPDAAATRALGEAIGALLAPGMSLHLCGDLGSGKTTIAQGMIYAVGMTGPVKSPTYALVEPYVNSRLSLYHFDFFRFRGADEWEQTGFRECFNEHSVCIIEWPERAAGVLPPPDLRLRLTIPPSGGRAVTIEAETERGRAALATLARSHSAR